MGATLTATRPVTSGDDAATRHPGSRKPGSHALGLRRIYILPTRHGTSFALALMVMLLGSINYDNALGYVLTFLLASVSLVSMLHACRNLSGVTVRAAETEPVFADTQARFALVLDNRGQRPRYGLMARYGRHGRGRAADDRVVHFSLAANSVQRIELPLPASQRGWFTPGRVVLATRFPFGLFRAWSVLQVAPRCLVYPRPGGTRELPAHRLRELGDGGLRSGGRDDFSGLRDYVPGDSPKHIHWKAVAREQGVPVKQFAGASSGVIVLRYEDAAGADTEARLSQLCRWVLEAEARGLRYGLALPGFDQAPDCGDTHHHACLRALALHGLDDAQPPARGDPGSARS